MPDRTETPELFSGERRGRAQVAGLLLAAVLCGGLAVPASGQTADPAATGGALSRERRAPVEKANARIESKESKEEALVVSATEADADDAEIEALRARVESASAGAERARLRLVLVERLASAGRKGEAVELLRSMLAEERLDPPFFFNTGNALARLGESGAAVEAYRKAAGQRRGNYARAQHNLGVVLMRLGRWEEALEALTMALRLEHYAYAEASYNLGRLHALRGEAGPAIQEWSRALKTKPDHTDAAVALARALAGDGDPVEGLAVLDTFAARFTGKGVEAPREIAVARGEIVAARNIAAFERGDREVSTEKHAASSSKASASLRSLSLGRETYALLRRAREARESKREEESVTLYRRVIEGSGGYFPPANLEMGFALASLGRNEEAVASLRRVAERDGERYPIAFYHLGRYYEHLGRLEEAGTAFARAAALLGDETPQFLLDVSRVREKEAKWADALAAAEAYVRAVERLGAVPEWAHERLARLRQKASTPITGEQK